MKPDQGTQQAEPQPQRGWQNRIVGHGEEAPDQLLANPKNWRIHPASQQEGLAALLDRVGWVQSVVVNKRTGFLVDGHLRVTLAMRRDEPTIPVVYVDLTEAEEDLVLATIDPISALAGTDQDSLRALLIDMGPVEGMDALLDSIAAKYGLVDLVEFPPMPEIEGDRVAKDQHTVTIEIKAVEKLEEALTEIRKLLDSHGEWDARIVA
jgi:hypothetical protein